MPFQDDHASMTEHSHLGTRTRLATRFAKGAAYQARTARALEEAGAAPNRAGWSDLCSTVVAALDQSVSFLDANFTELVHVLNNDGGIDTFPDQVRADLRRALAGTTPDPDQLLAPANEVMSALGLPPLTPDRLSALPAAKVKVLRRTLKLGGEAQPAGMSRLLAQSNQVLVAAGQAPLDRTSPVFEAARTLFHLRNAFTHPGVTELEFDDGQLLEPTDLEDRLSLYFPCHPSFPTYLPSGVMTGACATWAVRTALEYSAAFHAQLGFPEHEAGIRRDLAQALPT